MRVRKRLAIGLVAAVLGAASATGVAWAAPDPDSAAGTCGGDVTVGPGGEIGQVFVPTLKTLAEAAGTPLGQQIQIENEGEPGFAIPLACAQGHQTWERSPLPARRIRAARLDPLGMVERHGG